MLALRKNLLGRSAEDEDEDKPTAFPTAWSRLNGFRASYCGGNASSR